MSAHSITFSTVLDTDEAVTAGFLNDIVITAVEGGIGYWARVVSYDPDNGTATLVDDDTTASHALDRDVIAVGLARIVEAAAPFYDPNGAGTQCGSVPFLHASAHTQICSATWERDAGELDAGLADIIVQAGLFHQVLYG